MKARFVSRILSFSAITWALASPAFGQSIKAGEGVTPPANGTAREASQTRLSDIVVTARRREESLQSVPISATVFSSEGLDRRGIQSTQDLFGQIPSLVVGGSGQQRSSENVTIRGQGATYAAAPGVVLYFAEVPIIADQSNNAQNAGGANYYDLANVQVLRGPQGTLFGRNTTGGALLFEPQRPTDRFEGYGQVQYGNYDSVELRGAINVPIVEDRLLLRVAGIYQKRDGFTEELTTGTDLDDRNRYSLRAGLTWRPAEGIENYLMATMTVGNEHGGSTVLNAVPAGTDPETGIAYSTFLAEQNARGIRSVRLSPLDWREKTRYYSLTDIFSADLSDNLTFRTIANYSRLKHAAPYDGDGFPDDYAARLVAGQSGIGAPEIDPVGLNGDDYNYRSNSRQISVEPQLQGKLGDGLLTYVVGSYYENVRPIGKGGGQFSNPARRQKKSSSIALYAQGTIKFDDHVDALEGLSITAGYRYTWDRATAIGNFEIPNGPVISKDANFKAPTWTLGLDYKIVPDVLLYAKVSRGYKSGGVGQDTPAPELRVFQPEFVTAYEAGIKADWHIGSVPLRTNINYYYTKYKDLQRTGGAAYEYTDPVTGTTSTIFGAQTGNAGKAHIQGIEFEGEIRPFKWFTLSGNYSYLKAKYDEYTQLSLFPNGIPAFGLPAGFDCGNVPYDAPSNSCILDGLPFQFAPKNQFSLSGRIDLPVDEAIGNISLTATYSYVDAQYTSPTKAIDDEPYAWIGGNCPRNSSGSVVCGPNDGNGLLNVNVQWNSVMGSNFDLSAFATNLTNETYIIGSNGASYQSGFNSYVYGEPRMYGVAVRFRFGS